MNEVTLCHRLVRCAEIVYCSLSLGFNTDFQSHNTVTKSYLEVFGRSLFDPGLILATIGTT